MPLDIYHSSDPLSEYLITNTPKWLVFNIITLIGYGYVIAENVEAVKVSNHFIKLLDKASNGW